jgi:SAM-dependent methyltransferase
MSDSMIDKIKIKIRRIFYHLNNRFGSGRECPICGWQGYEFDLAGAANKVRFDCLCPSCGSLERHRLAYLVASKLDYLDFSAVLHVAPEEELTRYIKSRSNDYLSVDLFEGAMAKMDITALDLPDESKSLIWVSHVLEHVPDDEAAIAEMYRVLRTGGAAVVQVPIWRETTYEDFNITDPQARIKHFCQIDHVRLYGIDIVQRFEKGGFKVEVHRAQDLGPELMLKHNASFVSTNEVFVLRKL